MTLHRPLCGLATTANLTGALSRDTLVPERGLPVSVPCATTPRAVAWKLVIFALIESVDDVAALADAGTANAVAATSAASVIEWDRMPAGTGEQTLQVPSSHLRPAVPCLRWWIPRGRPGSSCAGKRRVEAQGAAEAGRRAARATRRTEDKPAAPP